VNGSLARDRLLGALDLWLTYDPSSAWLLEVLREVDPDSYRNASRDALAAKDLPAVAALAGQPEALTQPPRFAAAFSLYPGIPIERLRAVLNAALTARPGDSVLLMMLGLTYPVSPPGAAGERVRWLQAAVTARPQDARSRVVLAMTLQGRGDLDGAAAEYRAVIRLTPRTVVAHYNLGNVLQAKGDLGGAVAAYREAVRLDPNRRFVFDRLGHLLLRRGDLDGAAAVYREAIQVNPTFAYPYHNLGTVLRAKKDLGGAVAAYREGIRVAQDFAPIYIDLAWLLAAGSDRVRDGKQAVEHATRACELSEWKIPGYVDTLAAAHAEAGDFDRAVAFQKKALAFPDLNEAGRKEWQERLRLYEQMKPYRDPAYAPRELAPPPRAANR
jgi:tetratricopeptide (TPR) repeat protein